MKSDLTVLANKRTLQNEVHELAASLRTDLLKCEDSEIPVTLIPIMNGSFRFSADLLSALFPEEREAQRRRFNTQFHFVRAESYDGDQQGEVRLFDHPLREHIEGRSLVIVDDILDSGGTIRAVKDYVAQLGPRDIRVAVLIDKPANNRNGVTADYVGFHARRDVWLVGYGMDYNGLYREMPNICSLKKPEPRPEPALVVARTGLSASNGS